MPETDLSRTACTCHFSTPMFSNLVAFQWYFRGEGLVTYITLKMSYVQVNIIDMPTHVRCGFKLLRTVLARVGGFHGKLSCDWSVFLSGYNFYHTYYRGILFAIKQFPTVKKNNEIFVNWIMFWVKCSCNIQCQSPKVEKLTLGRYLQAIQHMQVVHDHFQNVINIGTNSNL